MLRVVHLAPFYYPLPAAGIRTSAPSETPGAAERTVGILAESLIHYMDYDVSAFTTGDATIGCNRISMADRGLVENLRERGIDPWHPKSYRTFHYPLEARAIEYLRRNASDFDLVHFHWTFDTNIFPLLDKLPIPLVMTSHTRFPLRADDTWTEAMQPFQEIIRRIPCIVLSQAAKAKSPSFLDPWWVIPHAVQPDFFTYPFQKREDYVFWYGTYNIGKAPHLAVQAARRANQKIVLSGLKNSPEQEEYYRQYVAPWVDGVNVIDLGQIGLSDVLYWVSRARAVIQPWLWWEPFGLIIAEALSLGTPLVILGRGAAMELVRGGDGFVIPVYDSQGNDMERVKLDPDYEERLVVGMAEALGRINENELDSPMKRRRRALGKFSPAQYALSTANAYQQVPKERY